MSLAVKTDDVTGGRRDIDPPERFWGEWVNVSPLSLVSFLI